VFVFWIHKRLTTFARIKRSIQNTSVMIEKSAAVVAARL